MIVFHVRKIQETPVAFAAGGSLDGCTAAFVVLCALLCALTSCTLALDTNVALLPAASGPTSEPEPQPVHCDVTDPTCAPCDSDLDCYVDCQCSDEASGPVGHGLCLDGRCRDVAGTCEIACASYDETYTGRYCARETTARGTYPIWTGNGLCPQLNPRGVSCRRDAICQMRCRCADGGDVQNVGSCDEGSCVGPTQVCEQACAGFGGYRGTYCATYQGDLDSADACPVTP